MTTPSTSRLGGSLAIPGYSLVPGSADSPRCTFSAVSVGRMGFVLHSPAACTFSAVSVSRLRGGIVRDAATNFSAVSVSRQLGFERYRLVSAACTFSATSVSRLGGKLILPATCAFSAVSISSVNGKLVYAAAANFSAVAVGCMVFVLDSPVACTFSAVSVSRLRGGIVRDAATNFSAVSVSRLRGKPVIAAAVNFQAMSFSRVAGKIILSPSCTFSAIAVSRLMGVLSDVYQWLDFEPVELSEVGGAGAVTIVGTGASLIQTPLAGFPDRPASGGSNGLRAAFNGDFNGAYLTVLQSAPRAALNVRVMAHSGLTAGVGTILRGVSGSDATIWELSVALDGTITLAFTEMVLSAASGGGLGWRSIEVEIGLDLRHATLYIDGVAAAAATLSAAIAPTGAIDFGAIGSASDVHGSVDLDELMIGVGYIGPVRSAPISAADSDPARWLVIYDATSSDSRSWAMAYQSRRLIPHINFVGVASSLDPAVIAATIVDYVFRHGLALQLRGLIAAYGISRDIITAAQAALAARADLLCVFEFAAPTLAIASALPTRADTLTSRIHCGVAISAITSAHDLVRVSSSWSQAATWSASLDGQQVRLSRTSTGVGHAIELSSAIAGPWTASSEHRAMVVGLGGGDPTDIASGAGSALAAGYAAVVQLAVATDLDLPLWFSALRAGKTFGEAAIASSASMPGATTRIVADPLGTCPLPLAGYELRARATPSGVESLAAIAPARSASLSWLPGANYDGYVRVVSVDAIGQADAWPVRLRRVQTDADGKLKLPLPPAPVGLSVLPVAGGNVAVTFAYRAPEDATPVASFRVYARSHADAWNWSSPSATVVAVGSSSYRAVVGPFATGATVDVVVRSVSSAGAEEPNTITRSAVADALAPDAITDMSLEVA